MTWHASVLYGQATPSLRACLAADPVLGPELHHLRELPHRFPRRSLQHDLPPGGLLAVPDVLPPDDRHRAIVPWDALFAATGPALRFSPPALLKERGLDPHAWPPPPALRYLKDLAQRSGAPLSFYRCEMWGGDVEFEAAWIPGWAPGEPDRVIFHLGEPGRVATAIGSRVTLEEGDPLRRTLEFHRLRLPSPYFAPHTRAFDWERCRVHRRPPPPPQIPGPERPEDPPPPCPRSLFRCVERGEREAAAAALAAGADPNAYAHEGPLERAASLGRADLVELLLRAGAKAVLPNRPSLLCAAADPACAALLFAAGAPLEGGAFHPPLAAAAEAGRDATARWLVERGASLLPPGHEHLVLRAACRGGLAWLVERALDAGAPVDSKEYGDTGWSALALAAGEGHREVVRLLRARGAATTPELWDRACAGGMVELIDELAAQGGAVDLHAGLMLAVRAGRGAAVRRLLELGADPGRERHGESPLRAAAWAGSREATRAILERAPAELHRHDENGWTALFAAVWRAHHDVVADLLAAGAAVDVVDSSGRSLRAEAALRGVHLPPAP